MKANAMEEDSKIDARLIKANDFERAKTNEWLKATTTTTTTTATTTTTTAARGAVLMTHRQRAKAAPVRKVIAKRKARALEKAIAVRDRANVKRDKNVIKRASRFTAKDVY